jgi:hypothetical protein
MFTNEIDLLEFDLNLNIDTETILSSLKSSPPTTSIMTLAVLRGIKVLGELELSRVGHKHPEYSKSLIKRLAVPVNPLLMATAISVSTIRNQDYLSFIQKYIEGFEIPSLEERLIRLDDFQDDAELDSILNIEASYIEGLYCAPKVGQV